MHYNTARPTKASFNTSPQTNLDAHLATVTNVRARQIRRKSVLNGLINEYLYVA